MLSKNWPWTELWWKLPFRILLDLVSGVQALVAGNTGFFGAVIKAHVAFLNWVFGSKSGNLFPATRSGKVHGYFKGSIVWGYFIQKKKTFKEIVQ